MDNNWLELLQNTNQLSEVIETNQYTERFGLTLSQQDVKCYTNVVTVVANKI